MPACRSAGIAASAASGARARATAQPREGAQQALRAAARGGGGGGGGWRATGFHRRQHLQDDAEGAGAGAGAERGGTAGHDAASGVPAAPEPVAERFQSPARDAGGDAVRYQHRR